MRPLDLSEKVEKVKRFFEAVIGLNNPQVEYALMRQCGAFQRAVYLMRACPKAEIIDFLRKLDDMAQASFERLVGVKLTNAQLIQAQLKSSLGGLGMRNCVDHQSAAFISCTLQVRSLVSKILSLNAPNDPSPDDDRQSLQEPHLAEHVRDFNSRVRGKDKLGDLTRVHGKPQKELSKAIDVKKKSRLQRFFRADLENLARLKSVGSKYSGAFLNAPLNFHRGPTMTGPEFIEAMLFRIGVSRFPEGSRCTLGHRGTFVHDSLSGHAVTCPIGGDVIRRHNDVADYIRSIMAQRFRVAREVPNILPNIGGGRRKPADLCIYGYATSTRPLACDVTIVSSVQQSSLPFAAAHDGAGAALKRKEDAKILKYAADLAAAEDPHEFAPLGLETYGFVGERLKYMLKTQARAIAREYDLNESQMTHAVFSGLSVTLQRNNARAILRRRPRRPPPHSLYDLIDPALPER